MSAGDYSFEVTIGKSGYIDTVITITVHCIANASITFIDLDAVTNGTGTRLSPLNDIPSINNGTMGDLNYYMFKRGTTKRWWNPNTKINFILF